MKKLCIITLLVLYTGTIQAQTSHEEAYVSLTSENDLYSLPGRNTDRYYTNGLRLDYYYTHQKFRFPSSLLLKISDDKNVFGWGLAQYIFTPSRIDVSTVQCGDRPYAGALFAIHSLMSYNYEKKVKLTTEIYFGVMGPLSLAREAQTTVHHLINSPHPEGWRNQIPNDLVLNYNMHLEKEMVYIPEKFLVTGNMEAFTGSLYDAIGAGFSIRLGKLKNHLQPTNEGDDHSKSVIYVVLRPRVRIIYFNALLRGGVITNIAGTYKGYTLDKDEIERINVFSEAGITYEGRRMRVTLSQNMRSAPFKGGNALEYGSFAIAFGI